MAVTAYLAEHDLLVEPGSEGSCELRIRNTGTIVDQFTFEVLGDAASWASVEPPMLSLFPGAEGTSVVRFHPPRSSAVPAGSVPFAVRVTSQEQGESIVVEGVVLLARFDEGFAELIPRTSHGRLSAVHQLAVDNRGNSPMRVRVTGRDPDEMLNFRIQPESRAIPAGAAEFFRVRVRPKKRFWRGQPKTRPFAVTVDPDGSPPLVVDGTMLQDRLLPKWVLPTASSLAAAALLLILLWFTLLKPQIDSAAKNAARATAAETSRRAAEAASAAEEAKKAVQDAAKNGKQLNELLQNPNVKALVSGSAGQGGPPFDHRLTANGARPGGPAVTDTFVVPEGKVLALTDLVFENPQGDVGTVDLQRDGKTLLHLALQNFRTYDIHYVAPVEVKSGQAVRLVLRCESPGTGSRCNTAAHLSGFLRPKAEPASASG